MAFRRGVGSVALRLALNPGARGECPCAGEASIGLRPTGGVERAFNLPCLVVGGRGSDPCRLAMEGVKDEEAVEVDLKEALEDEGCTEDGEMGESFMLGRLGLGLGILRGRWGC